MKFFSRADYDFNGEVDEFEKALFFLEMEEEDEAIMGRSKRSFLIDDDDDDDDLLFDELDLLDDD